MSHNLLLDYTCTSCNSIQQYTQFLATLLSIYTIEHKAILLLDYTRISYNSIQQYTHYLATLLSINTIEHKRVLEQSCPLAYLLVCPSSGSSVEKWVTGYGCHLEWWVGLVERCIRWGSWSSKGNGQFWGECGASCCNQWGLCGAVVRNCVHQCGTVMWM